MNIGLYTPYLDTLAGGEKYMLTLARCLSEKHTVSLFWNPGEEKFIKDTALKKLGIDITAIPFKKNIFDSTVSFLNRFITSKNYDAIIVLSDGSIPFLWTRTYLHFQNPVEWVKPSWKTRLKLSHVKKIVCNSMFTKSFIDKTFSVSSIVIYPPVAILKKNMQKENIILNVGRFGVNWQGSSFKKQDVLITTFKTMIERGLKNWKLVLVLGIKDDTEALKKLEQTVKGYPVEFLVNPDNEILWQQYNKAKIYWHAAGYGENLEKFPDRAEHFGIATVEAMGCGAVPVVINAGGQKEIVDETCGFLWNTTEEFISYTFSLTQNERVWENYSSAAIAAASKFDKDKFCNHIMSEIS